MESKGEISPEAKPGWVPVAALVATILLWASAFVAIRAALPDYGALGLTVGRLSVASATFGVLAVLLGVAMPARSDLGRLTLAGVLGMSGYQFLLNLGEREVSAATASIIVATVPVITVLMARIFLRERLDKSRWIAITIAAAGVVVVSLGQDGGLVLEPAALVVLAAAGMLAGYFIVVKPLLVRYRPFEATAWATWMGSLFAIPLLVFVPSSVGSAPVSAHLAVLLLGVGASAVGFVTWSVVLQNFEASVAAVYLYMVPPTTVVIGWVWLGELPSVQVAVGGVVALLGVAVGQHLARPRAEKVHQPGSFPSRARLELSLIRRGHDR